MTSDGIDRDDLESRTSPAIWDEAAEALPGMARIASRAAICLSAGFTGPGSGPPTT